MGLLKRCINCNQRNEDKEHTDILDCLKALIKRVEKLEDELLAKKLCEDLSRPSDSGFPPIKIKT